MAGHTDSRAPPDPSGDREHPVGGYRRGMAPDDRSREVSPDPRPDLHPELPAELRGVSPDPVRDTSTPVWVRLVALLLIVALVGYFVIAAF